MTETLTTLVNRKPVFTITPLDMGMQNRIPNSLPQAINVKLRLQNMTFFHAIKDRIGQKMTRR